MSKRFSRKLCTRFTRFLLLQDATSQPALSPSWQLSALRIILVFGLLLDMTIFMHSSWIAAQAGLYDIIGMVFAFFVTLAGTLYLSGRSLKQGAWSLLVIVYAAGFCILTTISNLEVAKLGIIFIYTAPLIALILLGARISMLFMGMNVIPFVLLLRNQPLPNLLHLSTTLPETHTYIQSLLFLFFNVGIPLAFSRVLISLHRATRHAQEANQELETGLAIHREIFEHNGSATLLCTQEGVVVRSNHKARKLLTWNNQHMEGVKLNTLLLKTAKIESNEDVDILSTENSGGIWKIRETLRPVLLQVTPMAVTSSLIVSLHDFSEIQQLRSELSSNLERANYLARHDRLTNLPNRVHFIEILSEKINKARQSGKQLAVLNIKIRDLRTVNERYGITKGDGLINQIGQTIQQKLRGKDQLGRTRGGAFSLLLADIPQGDSNIATRIDAYVSELPRWHTIEDQTLEISYFIGAATFPQDADNAQHLISFSEQAQHNARSELVMDPVYYDQNQAAATHRRIDLEVGLRKALRERSLTMHYQPKVNYQGHLRGLEALVRWNSPELGMVSPAEFIPVAEHAGMVHELTLQVIEMVIDQIKSWREQDILVCPVAINLSAIDLSVPTLAHEILSRTYLLDLPVDLLEFEMTETALMVNGDTGLQNLHELQKIGFRFSIDDFGSGYSSLSKMAHLPIYAIKIDRTFVQGIPGDTRREKVVYGILSLAHSLGLSIVAEGVENAQQLEFLHARGCHLFQGYHFHRPMTAQDAEKLLIAEIDKYNPLPQDS
ncbi:MAG: domain S-box/diguanylate cyclase protein [Proteobacteria bacterium]|nr:domain S-box/diguanylate cyclase protein [Pseudomonadota bacterium]